MRIKGLWRIQRFLRVFYSSYIKRLAVYYYDLFYDMPSISQSDLINPQNIIKVDKMILEDCYLSPYRGNDSHDDFTFIHSLVNEQKPNIILELGTALGNTTANFCKLLPDVKVYTVCALPEQISGDHITDAFKKDEIGRVFRKYGYKEQVTQIYEDTMNLDLQKNNIDLESIDLAIIDACHDENYVYNDFYKVLPFVKVGGIILFHDTHTEIKRHWWTSYLACLKIIRDGYKVKHVKNTWYGYYKKT